MSFNLWLIEKQSQPIIYLDFDETLAHEGENGYELRPFAKEFVKEVQKLGAVYILTYGLTAEHAGIAKELGLNIPVIGRDDYQATTPSSDSVLVDDKPASSEWTQKKLQVTGAKLIQIKPWFGGKDDKLKHILETLRSTLNEWVKKNKNPLPEKQPFKTYDKAKGLAKEREDKFYDGLREAADGHKVMTDIKSEESFKNKTVKRGKDAEVGDVLRGAILVDKEEQILEVTKRLKKIFVIKKVDYKTKPDKPFGYYGAEHLDVIIDGMICEIQIMTRRLWHYKHKQHKIYQKYRGETKIPKEMIIKSKEIFKKGNTTS